MSDKGGQHGAHVRIVAPPVGPIARLKQENRDLKLHADRCEIAWNTAVQQKGELYAEVQELKAEVDALKELQVAAEAIEGPADWFHKDVRLKIVTLHKAIRKARGME